MDYRTAGTAIRAWRDRLDQQFSTSAASQLMIRAVFVLWLVAFLFKHAGSSWDVAWHFRYPFGITEPPHIVNGLGSALAATLIVFQSMTGQATDRNGLLIMQGGFAIFLLSIPLDFLNHYLFGLDVTVWSPTHMLGFATTTIVLIGVLHSWLKLAAPGPWRSWVAFGFWAFMVDDVLYMLSQQEYGVIALNAYARGRTTASPELLALAGRNPELFVQGGIPQWVYPVWLIVTSSIVLAVARHVQSQRWTATIVAAIYLTYRTVGFLALGTVSFPQSFVPAMLLLGAFVIDLAADRHWHAWLTALMLIAVYYSSTILIDRYTLMPPFALSTAPIALILLLGGLAAVRWFGRTRTEQVVAQAV